MTSTPHRRTKRPATKLAGPYGHPLHPALIPVPIGAWVASFLFDLASLWTSDGESFVKGSFWLIALGIAGALAAAGFGLLDLVTIPRGTRAFTTAITHMVLNLTAVVLFAIGLAMRRGGLEDGSVQMGPLAVSAVALLLIAISGWLGGRLAYTYGVRVAEEQDQEAGFR